VNADSLARFLRRAQRAYRRGGVLRFLWYARDRVTRPFLGYSLDFAYAKDFFEENISDSRPMADDLAPRLVEALKIRRIVDMGCAAGHWIAAFLRSGVDAFGVEGSHTARPFLLCPENRVIFTDLRKRLKLPPRFIGDGVDLVLSLEVAEHIEARYARVFVKNLVMCQPRWIVMTAAPPGQGGTYHMNEQPPEYWRDLLANVGYQSDPSTHTLLTRFVEEAKGRGVHIPFWMPKNLLVFTRGRAPTVL